DHAAELDRLPAARSRRLAPRGMACRGLSGARRAVAVPRGRIPQLGKMKAGEPGLRNRGGSLMRMNIWSSACLVAIGVGSLAAPAIAADNAVNVVSFGGAYTKSQVEAMHKPFTAKTGIAVNSIDYNGGLAEVKAQHETNNVIWDVVDLLPGDAVLGCN